MPTAPLIPARRVSGTLGRKKPTTIGSFEGAFTYSRNLDGPYVKHWIESHIPAGTDLTRFSPTVRAANALWHTLSAEIQSLWKPYAARKALTPYAHFIGVQLARFLHGQDLTPTPIPPAPITAAALPDEPPPAPDCTGIYKPFGTYLGNPMYARNGGEYFLYYYAPQGAWMLADTYPPDAYAAAWRRASLDPNGPYDAYTNATGRVNVADVPPL